MFYSGGEDTGFDWKVGYAWSLDGSNWIKESVNGPELDVGVAGNWDDMFVAAGGVAVIPSPSETDSLYMWYGGGDAFSVGDIGLAKTSGILDVQNPLIHSVPQHFELQQNYPNPFNPITNIEYSVGAYGNTPLQVELSIYNLLGQKVATLVNKKQQAGNHSVQWDASGFAAGVYYYKIVAGEYQQVKKMVLIK
jgi:hypothetical protein